MNVTKHEYGQRKKAHKMVLRASADSFRVRILNDTKQTTRGNAMARRNVVENRLIEYMPTDEAAKAAAMMRNARQGSQQRNMRKKYKF